MNEGEKREMAAKLGLVHRCCQCSGAISGWVFGLVFDDTPPIGWLGRGRDVAGWAHRLHGRLRTKVFSPFPEMRPLKQPKQEAK